MADQIKGRIHSVESFGAVDGPGIRFVVFLQGCPLRCLFCHNPDTWDGKAGREVSAQELVDEILTYRNYIKKGGVTLSGGEPLLQAQFTAEVLRLCKENGLHTAVDTSGCIPLERALPALQQADMLLLDIKDIDPDDAKALTGMTNQNAIATLDYCEKVAKTVWVRHVVVPGYTLNYDKLERLAEFLSGYNCVEKVELLPFHKRGEYKWEVLGEDYKLFDTEEPTQKEMAKVKGIFRSKGILV